MKPLGILVLILLIPIAIIGSIFYGLLYFTIYSLDFLKDYFEIIKKELEE